MKNKVSFDETQEIVLDLDKNEEYKIDEKFG